MLAGEEQSQRGLEDSEMWAGNDEKRLISEKCKQTDLEKDCKIDVIANSIKTRRFCDETQKSNFICVAYSPEVVWVGAKLVTGGQF